MSKKPLAVEALPEKIWITYDSQKNKSGTLTVTSDSYVWYKINGERITIDDINKAFEFKQKSTSTWHQQHVFGYPALGSETFNNEEQDNLPCFTKTENSKVFYAAGYYAILFENNGWTASFCPKVSTLRTNTFLGPFKTENDRDIVLLRKKRADNQ